MFLMFNFFLPSKPNASLLRIKSDKYIKRNSMRFLRTLDFLSIVINDCYKRFAILFLIEDGQIIDQNV